MTHCALKQTLTLMEEGGRGEIFGIVYHIKKERGYAEMAH